MQITQVDIKRYQKRVRLGMSKVEFIILGIELRDKFGLTDEEVLSILNRDKENVYENKLVR